MPKKDNEKNNVVSEKENKKIESLEKKIKDNLGIVNDKELDELDDKINAFRQNFKNMNGNNIIEFSLKKINYSKDEIGLIIFGINSENIEEFYNTLINLSLIHLFVISGYHFNFLYVSISKIIKSDKIMNFYELKIERCFFVK